MMALAASTLLSLAAWLALAMAMERHQRDVFGRAMAGPRVRWLRAAGGMLLAASPVPMVQYWGALTGLSIWGALISLPAIALVLAITARAHSTGARKPASAAPARSRSAVPGR